MTDLRQCTDESAHGEHEWYEDNTFRRQCTGFVGRAGVPLGPEPPSRDWGEWAPGKGWERMQAEHPGMVPDITEEDSAQAAAIIAAAGGGTVNAELMIRRPPEGFAETVRWVFERLHDNLPNLAGSKMLRPATGEAFWVFHQPALNEWLAATERAVVEDLAAKLGEEAPDV